MRVSALTLALGLLWAGSAAASEAQLESVDTPLEKMRILKLLPGRDGLIRFQGDWNPKLRMDRFDQRLIIPVHMWEDFSLNVAWVYSMHRFGDAERAGYRRSQTMHRFRFELGSFVKLREDLMLILTAGPQIASDFERVTARDLTAYAHAVVAWEQNENWSVHFGLAFTRVMDLYLPIPVFLLIYRPPGDPLSFEIVLPSHGRVNYRIPGNARVFAEVGFESFQWDVEPRRNTPRRTASFDDSRLIVGLDLEPTPGLFAGLYAGTSVVRRTQEEVDGQKRSRWLKPGFIGGLSVTLTPAIVGR